MICIVLLKLIKPRFFEASLQPRSLGAPQRRWIPAMGDVCVCAVVSSWLTLIAMSRRRVWLFQTHRRASDNACCQRDEAAVQIQWLIRHMMHCSANFSVRNLKSFVFTDFEDITCDVALI